MDKRGIVITTPFTFDGTTLSVGSAIDPVSLRHYLLYWDLLDWPDNNIISFDSGGADIECLQSLGVLDRTRVQFTSFDGNIGYAILWMQLAAFQKRNNEQPGCWSLAQQSQVLASSPKNTFETRTIEVDLCSAVPVPTADISFEDILQFKEKRHAELLCFRSVMDDLYQEVARAADIPRAKLQAVSQVEKAMQELHAVFGESFARRLISSLKVELNIPNIAVVAAGGAAAATTFGFPLALGAAVGAVAAAVKFEFKVIRKAENIPDQLKDYAYLHHIEKDLC
jgi:hypothetical protein